MAIVTKSIKPQKLHSDVFRLEVLTGMNEVGREMTKDFEKTTQTWKNKPEFVTLRSTRSGNLELLVGTDDTIYKYVDEGTKPHWIFPVRAKALAFPSGYTAKTTPNVIGSKAGGPHGNTVFAMGVLHPGTQPRNFDIMIQKKFQPRFKRRMEEAMRIAAKKSGHGK